MIAALATLAVMDRALGAGFVLKDATGFNILVFDGVVPKLVDVPSIEPYVEGRVWAGYGQLPCRSFLFPAPPRGLPRTSMSKALLRGTLGEVPVGFTASLFGLRDYARPGVLKDVKSSRRDSSARSRRSTGAVKRETSTLRWSRTPRLFSSPASDECGRSSEASSASSDPARRASGRHTTADCTYSDADRAAEASHS